MKPTAGLAALACLLMLSGAQAIHVCNSGWKDYWWIEDDDSFGSAVGALATASGASTPCPQLPCTRQLL